MRYLLMLNGLEISPTITPSRVYIRGILTDRIRTTVLIEDSSRPTHQREDMVGSDKSVCRSCYLPIYCIIQKIAQRMLLRLTFSLTAIISSMKGVLSWQKAIP